MAFGLCGAPITITKLMKKLAKGMKDIVSYLDDILLYHINLQDHIRGLKSLLERIRQSGVTVRFD